MTLAEMFKIRSIDSLFGAPPEPDPEKVSAAIETLGGPDNAAHVMQAVAVLQAKGYLHHHTFDAIVEGGKKHE